MPSRDVARRYMGTAMTIGEQLKQMSDDVMQDTFYNDIQTRKCYLYDIYHDNRPNLCNDIDGYDEDDCQKKAVDCKFIVKTYKSVVKDDPEYHIQFIPEDWNSHSCVPDWWNATNSPIHYKELGVRFPIGLYIDIPDDRGIYNRWLIVYDEVANQFPKFGVLRCNHCLQWITNRNDARIVREQWCVEKTQNSSNWCVMFGNLHNEMSLNCWELLRAILPQHKNEKCLSVKVKKYMDWKISSQVSKRERFNDHPWKRSRGKRPEMETT